MRNIFHGNYNVLVIEDDFQLNRLFNKYLMATGFHTCGADSIKSAIGYLQTNPIPVVIVLDWQLVDGTGEELLDYLCQAGMYETRVIVISANNLTSNDLNGHQVEYTLLKPVSPRGLSSLVATLIEEIAVS